MEKGMRQNGLAAVGRRSILDSDPVPYDYSGTGALGYEGNENDG
jgi:hypothetical protein